MGHLEHLDIINHHSSTRIKTCWESSPAVLRAFTNHLSLLQAIGTNIPSVISELNPQSEMGEPSPMLAKSTMITASTTTALASTVFD